MVMNDDYGGDGDDGKRKWKIMIETIMVMDDDNDDDSG